MDDSGRHRPPRAGCTDYFPDAARIELAPGTCRPLIGYKTWARCPTTLGGNDSDHIFLWLAVS
jgi:hypothetical protein